METKQVIVVRKDLKMRKGKIAAQVAHASMGVFFKRFGRYVSPNMNATYSFTVRVNEPIDTWIRGAFTKIVVSCNSEEELLELYDKVNENNIPCCLIQDSGKTEFHGIPTYTALAIGPDEVSKIDEMTSHLKLL